MGQKNKKKSHKKREKEKKIEEMRFERKKQSVFDAFYNVYADAKPVSSSFKKVRVDLSRNEVFEADDAPRATAFAAFEAAKDFKPLSILRKPKRAFSPFSESESSARLSPSIEPKSVSFITNSSKDNNIILVSPSVKSNKNFDTKHSAEPNNFILASPSPESKSDAFASPLTPKDEIPLCVSPLKYTNARLDSSASLSPPSRQYKSFSLSQPLAQCNNILLVSPSSKSENTI